MFQYCPSLVKKTISLYHKCSKLCSKNYVQTNVQKINNSYYSGNPECSVTSVLTGNSDAYSKMRTEFRNIII